MAHLIDMTNARANMAYTGDKPWHGLGSVLTPDAPLEVWCEQAGFNWEVKKAAVIGRTEDGQEIAVPNRWALYRSDNLAPLSVMSSNFHITQPKDVAEFFRELVTVAGFKMETMGMLRGGKNYWALARVDDSFDVGGGDVVLPYLMLGTSCDGTMSNYAGFTTIRVVCWNTLSAATLYDEEGRIASGGMLRIPHSTKFNPEKVKTQLGLIGGTWIKYKKDAKEMAKRKVSKEEAIKFFVDTLYPKMDSDEIDLEVKRPMLEKIIQIYESGVGQSTKTAKGTAFGLVNAVTRFVDHERQGASNDSRLASAWFGQGNLQKQRAWNTALQLLAA